MESIKTFKDLEFEMHHLLSYEKHAVMEFENGYGISVIFGEQFYSNGVDTYEVAIIKDNHVCFDTPLTDTVLAYQSEDEVTEIMRKVQELNK